MIKIRFRKFIRKHGTWKQDDRGKALLDEDDYEEFGDYLKEQIQWLSLHQQDSPKLAMNKLKKMALRVPENLPLYDILNEFQKHMAVVVRQCYKTTLEQAATNSPAYIGYYMFVSMHPFAGCLQKAENFGYTLKFL
ncbi:hypothetical protein Tco_0321607 [Tanacetum coccineum]